MAKPFVIIAAILVVVPVASFAGAEETMFQVAMGTPVVWTYQATPATAAVTVAIVDNPEPAPAPKGLFEPQTVDIAVGSTVIWTNLDHSGGFAQHTATAEGTTPDGDPLFDTGVLDPGSSNAHTFDTAGEFPYFCAFHPDMTGVIRVS